MTDDNPHARLADRWRELVRSCGLPESEAAPFFQQLLDAYCEPQRFYHNLRHIAEILDLLSSKRAAAHEPDLLELAAWYHDLVYDPRAKDNEERSAVRATEALRRLGMPADRIARVVAIIRMTREHRPQEGDAGAQLFLDADLAILGALPDKYKEYARAIRHEYAWVAEPDYRVGRSAVLQRFLDRPRIFGTDDLFQHLEARARSNLAEEIAELS